MATLKKYTIDGEEQGTVDIPDSLLIAEASDLLVHASVRAMCLNRRQLSAHTKTRGDVRATGKKPHKQKGTGRARQGSIAAPHYRGGGVAFGPRKKFDQRVQINRKEKRRTVEALIVEKLRNEMASVLMDPLFAEPKTARVANFLDKAGIQEKVLFLLPSTGSEAGMAQAGRMAFIRSLANLPCVKWAHIRDCNAYELLLAKKLVWLDSALEEWRALHVK